MKRIRKYQAKAEYAHTIPAPACMGGALIAAGGGFLYQRGDSLSL